MDLCPENDRGLSDKERCKGRQTDRCIGEWRVHAQAGREEQGEEGVRVAGGLMRVRESEMRVRETGASVSICLCDPITHVCRIILYVFMLQNSDPSHTFKPLTYL